MQFIRGGPDIPDEVIAALQEDRLILFCGAGISMPALPSFRGLVEKVYQRLHEDVGLDPAEARAFKSRDYDRLLDLLERRVERKKVRDAVVAELTAPPTAPTDRHSNALELAKAADGAYRIVTTNFDDLFERAISSSRRSVTIDEAPKLPMPLPHRWSSLVHLHGRIDRRSGSGGDNLILSSADFGRAYLTEGWASRFVTDLFAHFSVVFVGYSADDPIIRYLLDALAAERSAAKPEDRPRKAYALAGYPPGNAAALQTEWWNKGVDAIAYRIQRGRNHSLLYRTLEEWARWKREGLTGRFRQVEQAWRYHPPATPPYGHEIQQVLWALKDPVCAQRFAESPTPAPLHWRAVLEQAGMLSCPFSPAGDRAVPLVGHGNIPDPPLDEVTYHLGQWLTRHLDKPELLNWVLEHGGVLHQQFRYLILQRMRFPEQETPEPRHCPPLKPLLRRAWEIIATTADLIDCRYQTPMLSTVVRADTGEDVVRAELIAALRPTLKLKKPDLYLTLRNAYAQHGIDAGPPSVRDHLDGEVLLAGGSRLTELRTFIYSRTPNRDLLLAALVDDLTAHLKRTLDLFALIGQAHSDFDPGNGHVLSILRHPHLLIRDWTFLVELLRDGLPALYHQNRRAAAAIVIRWGGYPYPLFRRLAMFAATALPDLGLCTAQALLTADNNLWSAAPTPENIDLLAFLWVQIDETQRHDLIGALLRGPDAPGGTPEERERVDYVVWLRLSRLASIGTPELPTDAASRLARLEDEHPWRRSADNREDSAVRRSGFQWGFETDLSAEQMLTMPVEQLVEKLIEPDHAT
jgi:hypothetical protein